ncbi:insulinase family protein [Candidatus Pacearchaeota archaeon]|nr:insulinase family protein [Candidatus Pacearchaeota archaeon]
MESRFFRKKLKNGLRVVYEKRELPLVSLSITNPFGAVYENSKIKGIAHFIEHLVFTGTKTRTHEDISREIEKKGGILNAFTAQDVTSFWFKLPSEHVFAGLDIITDIMNNPIFEEKKFEKEKKVVIEEIKMYHDMPQKHVMDQIESNLYGKPFGEGIAGSVKTLNELKRDFVADYFKNVYTGENYIVTIVGDVDFDKVCEYLEKKFISKSRNLELPKIEKWNKNSVEKRAGIDQAHFVLAFHAPLFTDKEYYDLAVLDAYLARGMSSKLFLEIREKRGLAYTVRSSLATEKNYSYYSVYVGTTKKAVKEVHGLIVQGFKDVEKMNEKDLEEAKEMLIGLRKVSSEESSDVMNELMYHELIGKAEDYYDYENKVMNVKLEDVKRTATNAIKKYSTAAIVPK